MNVSAIEYGSSSRNDTRSKIEERRTRSSWNPDHEVSTLAVLSSGEASSPQHAALTIRPDLPPECYSQASLLPGTPYNRGQLQARLSMANSVLSHRQTLYEKSTLVSGTARARMPADLAEWPGVRLSRRELRGVSLSQENSRIRSKSRYSRPAYKPMLTWAERSHACTCWSSFCRSSNARFRKLARASHVAARLRHDHRRSPIVQPIHCDSKHIQHVASRVEELVGAQPRSPKSRTRTRMTRCEIRLPENIAVAVRLTLEVRVCGEGEGGV